MLRVALSGGIASGKTTVSDTFASFGVPVIDADILARQAVAPASEGLEKITSRFGKAILTADGTLDRKKLRSVVFDDSKARSDLEKIVHPQVRQLTLQQLNHHEKKGAPYALIVIPLLIETEQQSHYDHVIIVDVDRETQINRIAIRDRSSRELAEKILASQATREQRLSAADDVIYNECSKEELVTRVEELHHKLNRLAATQ